MNIVSLAGAILLAIPGMALAHTRWFAESKLSPHTTNEQTSLYLLVWACIAIIIITLGIYFEKKGILQLSFLHPTRDHAFPRAAATFSMIAGAFFVVAGTHSYLFSPNLSIASGTPSFLVVLQILIGIAFLAGVYARVAAAALAFLWFASFAFVDPILVLENIWVFGTALFVLIMGSDYFSLVSFRAFAHLTRPFHDYALPLLRVGAGATLLILGFSEKILRPEFGINFLAQYDWNFMQAIGFQWFSDYLFTISAGAVEALVGFIFILGIVTRLNALIILIIFAIPMFILGPIELGGHLPHLAAVALLLLFGGGNKLKIIKSFKR